MKEARNILALLLLGCLGMRLAAWLISPVIPLLGVLFVLVAVATVVSSRFTRL